MKKILSLVLLLILSSTYIFSQSDGEDVVIGKYHVIQSKILKEQRRILVRLPLGYEDTKLNYPVVFHLYGDFVMTYFADAASTIERLHDANKMPQVILIGVDNTDRYRDLRPFKRDGSPGGIEAFIRYFKEELMPYIKKKYRTVDYNILIGPQAGACFGLYALMEHTDLFDAFILENSFQNPAKIDEFLISKAKSFFKANRSLNKFLFMKCKQGSRNLQLALKEKTIIETNTPKDFRFKFRLTDQGDDVIISAGIKHGLLALFSDYTLPKDLKIGRLDDIKKYYQQLSKKWGFPVNISDRILRDAAHGLRRSGKGEETRKIFEYILKLYPKSLDGLFQLAEIYVKMGKYKEARNFYLEFLKIRPHEAFIKKRLQWVEKKLDKE